MFHSFTTLPIWPSGNILLSAEMGSVENVLYFLCASFSGRSASCCCQKWVLIWAFARWKPQSVQKPFAVFAVFINLYFSCSCIWDKGKWTSSLYTSGAKMKSLQCTFNIFFIRCFFVNSFIINHAGQLKTWQSFTDFNNLNFNLKIF